MMNEVICKEVIITTLKTRGTGKESNPIRMVKQVFEKDGTFIAEYDTELVYTKKDLIEFAIWAIENDCSLSNNKYVDNWMIYIDQWVDSNR